MSKSIEVKRVHVNDGDTIVVTYDKNLVSPSQANDTYELIRDEFPNNLVVLVPKGVEFAAVDKER